MKLLYDSKVQVSIVVEERRWLPRVLYSTIFVIIIFWTQTKHYQDFYTNDGVVGETHMNNKKTKQVTINEVRDLFNFNDTLKYCVNLKENSPQVQVPFDVDPDWEGYRLGAV